MCNFLKCENICKTYHEGTLDTEVLKGINFEMDSGELVSIIGASGSGKSTLLHILGALDEATTGKVLFLDYDMMALHPNQQAKIRNKHLGFIYQFHHLLMDFSVLENVAMPLLIAGKKVSIAIKEAKALLDQIALGHRLEHRPSELSGGERQRVAIARALVNKPDLVLADEPTGNLDQKTALGVYNLILELNKESGIAFLVVTHDIELAMNMERQMKMQDGILLY
ncbi:lipoprotein-releasing system ATP-binding protein [Candidatus Photodesmus katoptron]|uniref:Lipoprotein-releasing system ATP-binding protein LolD n=1 Tax=Candidatus Photodesmus katoptron Akat1 TaxID=1236703 RepID=S3EI14_9GAMM|nr:lipoprotein-releasing ABC transporter ATP-binding protein LolD [Candidatus Photodesmus katoptron]EPE37808.1 lipoprotein releasing system, ATP-binding protein [Candidatus Photodesmus katoptron Akat1]KEY90473.1 lipoprotein-releasing system ATP-binding protein [Candidatus Photodesmus katoptron]